MDKQRPLLLENPRAFMEIVMNHDPATRVRSFYTYDDAVTCEIMRHGIFNGFSKLAELVQLYDGVVLPARVDRRKEIYGHVKMIVSGLGGHTAPALAPFMLVDDDIEIVATATVDYASLGDLDDGNPMSRPRDVAEMVAGGEARNPAAVLGGLLALGDPRVCELVKPFRSMLDENQAGVVSQCFTGLTAKCMVDFYLDWLEELVVYDAYEARSLFGVVAAGLVRLADRRSFPSILDGLRPFPTLDSNWPDMRAIDPGDFANSIADRLYALEAREARPKVLPHVIRAFGLVPRAAAADTAIIQ